MDRDEIRDCRFCEWSDASSPNCKEVECYRDIGEHIHDPANVGKECHDFVFCDIFPKT